MIGGPASSFATTLYPDASVEIDPAIPGAEVHTRYPHPDIKTVGSVGATTPGQAPSLLSLWEKVAERSEVG